MLCIPYQWPATQGCHLCRQRCSHASIAGHQHGKLPNPFLGMAQMIYVEGLPEGVSVDEVAEHFGSIGVVKFDKKKNQKKVPGLAFTTSIVPSV